MGKRKKKPIRQRIRNLLDDWFYHLMVKIDGTNSTQNQAIKWLNRKIKK